MTPPLESLAPLFAVAALALALPARWLASRRAQAALVAGMALLVARYLHWRLTVTVLPAQGLDAGSALVWGLFGIELLAWFDAGVMYATLLRRTDRTPEADAHEAALDRRAPETLPTVDVFVATYDEPLEVLERTIVGALALRWPADRLRVWVLDDGRRDWLAEWCARKGVRRLTRPDNAGAKAGNINAAIRRTDGEFFMVLDADFVPRRDFLRRTMGFFDDPRVGIVQVPHGFFNNDPMQTNLSLRDRLPDDQRLFFDAIMPGRDGWDCAFCCGSNSVTRRAALEAAGGGLPTGSVTEDMLLTLVLLRRGYVTRYLDERLAVGLAPESLSAFFVQRARWARGAMQILHLRDGPLGPGLSLRQRLLFLPTHWLSQSLAQTAAMTVPAVYLWTGLPPLIGATAEDVIAYQLPAILAAFAATRRLAPSQFFPLAATVHAVLQAFRLLPVVLSTLVRPRGHAFRVTPKGAGAAGGPTLDRPTFWTASGLMVATALGLLLNWDYNLQRVADGSLVPIVSFWALVNMVTLTLVAALAVSRPRLRAEERFALDAPCTLLVASESGVRRRPARLLDLSLSGARLELADSGPGPAPGDWTVAELDGVGRVPAAVRRAVAAGARRGDGPDRGAAVGLQFHLPESEARDRLIRRLFTRGLDNSTRQTAFWPVFAGLLARALTGDRPAPAPRAAPDPGPPPSWAAALSGLGAPARPEGAAPAAPPPAAPGPPPPARAAPPEAPPAPRPAAAGGAPRRTGERPGG